ncbi:hypothetical protein BDW22DRAFT_1323188 [Trametopsis cervina]|nr:hypothetical protein BDW22DRAFT_1323188 [Trametopsis cervina]
MDALDDFPAHSARSRTHAEITQTSSTLELSNFSAKSRQCIERLLAHEADTIDIANIPYKKRAAVLILLYEKEGDLRVLLTTRSKTLRAHPGQTALPGGKVDDTDKDVIETAYREANEEVGLPMYSSDVHKLCILRPFVSASKLLVTPVVALLTNLDHLDRLTPSEGEVDVIFDHPLEAILDPPLSAKEKLVEIGSSDWPAEQEFYNFTDYDIQWLGNTAYRMHRLRSSASAIKGLTAEILIATAVVAYDRQPSYSRFAPGQLTTIQDIIRSVDPATFADSQKLVISAEHTAQATITA